MCTTLLKITRMLTFHFLVCNYARYFPTSVASFPDSYKAFTSEPPPKQSPLTNTRGT